MQLNRSIVVVAVVATAIFAVAGCQRGAVPVVLKPEAFFRESTIQKADAPVRRTAIDQPGAVNYDSVRLDLLRPEGEKIGPLEPAVTEVPPAVAKLVPSPQNSNTQPLPPLGMGVASTVGRVVVEVNGEPIYSSRVLRPIEPDLAANAKDKDPEQYKKYAAKAIREQVDFLIRTELEVAAAKKNLNAQETLGAEGLTMDWRVKQIREAGGSIEQARKKATDQGTTFEDQVKEEYRANLVRIFYSKRIFPRVQVTAEEMRRYYVRNKDAKFSDRAGATFRLIKVDLKKVGDRATAAAKATELRDRARQGEDFATLAKEYNDDPRLRGNGGEVGTVEKGAFARQAVETAVWNLSPGEVSDAIEDSGAFYVAKMEQKSDGRVRDFNEEAVQDQIRNELRSQQLAEMRDRQRESLMKGAVVNPYPPPIEPLLEIVMQRYPYWAMKVGG